MMEELFRIFKSENKQLYLVGGAVRDKILGNQNDDLDFATDALPEETIQILKKHSLCAIPVGLKFGTVQTEIGNLKVDITTFRCNESYSQGSRNPDVVFGKDIKEDLARRDFTFNAIAMREDCSFIDPFFGYKDLLDKVLRTPIYPYVSFGDDPLRMLRACRFVARFDLVVEHDTFHAMCSMSHRIKEITAERIFQEISKLLMLPDPTKGLELMVNAGLMKHVFPELQNVADFKQNQGKWHSKLVWPHTLEVVRNSPEILEVRWAALFHDVAKPQTYSETESGVHFYGHEVKGALMWDDVALRLKVSNNFHGHVYFLIYEHLQPSLLSANGVENVSDKALRRLIARAGDWLDNLFHLSIADITSHKPNIVAEKRSNCLKIKERCNQLKKELVVEKIKLPKGTGSVISEELGIKGKELGIIMKKLEEMLIDGEIQAGTNFAAKAKELYQKHTDGKL